MTRRAESEKDAHLHTAPARWRDFVNDFFQPPNALAPGAVPELDAALADAERLVVLDPPGPVILPAKLPSGTRYFGIAFNDDQARTLRELLRSHLGNTWTDFDGQSLANRADMDALDSAAIALAGGSAARVFRLAVADDSRADVRRQVAALLRALAERPSRDARLIEPIGRILGDFADACATRAEQAARAAFDRLASDHRISAANRLFLRVQLLATFERWDDLDDLAGISDVLHLPRPALTSDALARFALAKIASPFSLAAFQLEVAPRFGALIESTTAIRSAVGARYYVLWSLMAGELPSAVGARLAGTGWADDAGVAQLLIDRDDPELAFDRESEADLRYKIVDAIAGGRYDAAVDMLSRLPPSESDLQAVVFAVRASLSRPAIDLLDRYRDSLGSARVDDALKQDPSLASERDPTVSEWAWAERIAALLSVDTAPAERGSLLEGLEGPALAELVAQGGLDECVSVVRKCLAQDSGSIDTRGIDGCIDIVREVYRTGLAPPGLAELALAVIEVWAYHDRSGDRRKVRRIMFLAEILLEFGVAPARFDELVELLRLGWDPFLTDADIEVGLDAIELLAPYRSTASAALDSFARPLLARIGPHNVHRIPDAALEVAADLAREFGIGMEVARPDSPDHADGRVSPNSLDGTVLALYSLMEGAMERAAGVLRRRHPGLVVVTLAEHVASDELRGVARTADLVVVMDRAAKHAATDALRLARGSRPLRFAAGKGSTSLIVAAEEGLGELAGSSGS